MEAIEIAAEARQGHGKGANRKLRAQGRIPAVVYGQGVEKSLSVSLCPRELGKALTNPKKSNALFKINLEGTELPPVLVRELQRDPVSRAILHVDLVSPDLSKERLSVIPIRFEGKSKGVAIGGRLRTPYRDVRVTSLPEQIPAEVVVDISDLGIGDAVMASTLALPESTRAVFDNDYVVAKVLKPRGGDAGAEDDTGGSAESEGESDSGADG